MADPPPSNGLGRLRLAAGWTFLGLIVILALSSLTNLTPGVDLGVFTTLVGAFLATAGAGVVIKLFGPGK